MTYALAYAVVFIKISLAVLQQRHVEEGRVFLIPPQSMVMQFFDAATYGLGGAAFMSGDWLQIGAMGLGAGSGSLVAMWVDRRYLRQAQPDTVPPSPIGRALRNGLGGAWSPKLRLVRPEKVRQLSKPPEK